MPVTGTVEPSGEPGRTRFVSGKNGRRFAGALILVFCFAVFSGAAPKSRDRLPNRLLPVEVNPDEGHNRNRRTSLSRRSSVMC